MSSLDPYLINADHEPTTVLKLLVQEDLYLASGPWFDVRAYKFPQTAVDKADAAGGGTVYFPPGVTICNILVPSNIRIQGAGKLLTTLKSAAGSNQDVIKGVDFDSLTGTAKQTPQEFRGNNFIQILDLTIDGDADNNLSAGWGIRIWGHHFLWSRLMVKNCRSGGIWTEYTTHDAVYAAPPPYYNRNLTKTQEQNSVNSLFLFIQLWDNFGPGWDFRGPHDANIWRPEFTHNGRDGISWGFQSSSSPGAWDGTINTMFAADSWNNTGPGCYQFGASIANAISCVASGSPTGTGIGVEFVSGVGSSKWVGGIFGGLTTGLIMAGQANQLLNVQFLNVTGDLIQINGAGSCVFDFYGDLTNTSTGVHVISETLANKVIGFLNNPGSGTLYYGSFSSADVVQLYQFVPGNSAPQPFFTQYPDWLSGSIATGSSTILSNTSVGPLTIAVPGARVGDYIDGISWDQALVAGWVFTPTVSANDTVVVNITNNTGADRTVAAGTLRVRVKRA